MVVRKTMRFCVSCRMDWTSWPKSRVERSKGSRSAVMGQCKSREGRVGGQTVFGVPRVAGLDQGAELAELHEVRFVDDLGADVVGERLADGVEEVAAMVSIGGVRAGGWYSLDLRVCALARKVAVKQLEFV